MLIFQHTCTTLYLHLQKVDSEAEKREQRMATGAVEMMLRCVFEGGISAQDMEIERRPYHHNCNCKLHKLKGVCSNACSQQRNISFHKKQSWTDCSLCTATSAFSSQSSFVDNSSARNFQSLCLENVPSTTNGK